MLKKIGFYGLSHLGLCYSAAFAKKKFKVTAIDEDRNKINKLKKNIIDVFEKGLLEILKKKNILYSNKIDVLNKCEIVFFTNDVKTNSKNVSNIIEIKKKIIKLDQILNPNISLVILSQVPPGFIRSLKLKRKLYYQVETLIFGDAISRALNPERIILGKENSSISLDKNLKQIYRKFSSNILEMNYESAELAKISINLMLISSIMTSNFISLYCEKINANWSDIKKSLQLDKRIGKFAYLNPSPGLSGGNLERDLINANKYFNYKNVLKSWINLDKKMKMWTVRLIKKNLKKKSKILISGMTYKNNTLSVKNSLSLFLIKKLHKFCNMTILEKKNSQKFFKNIKFIENLKKDKTKYDCIIFVNNTYKKNLFKSSFNKETIFIDPYNFYNSFKIYKNYFSIGNNK